MVFLSPQTDRLMLLSLQIFVYAKFVPQLLKFWVKDSPCRAQPNTCCMRPHHEHRIGMHRRVSVTAVLIHNFSLRRHIDQSSARTVVSMGWLRFCPPKFDHIPEMLSFPKCFSVSNLILVQKSLTI